MEEEEQEEEDDASRKGQEAPVTLCRVLANTCGRDTACSSQDIPHDRVKMEYKHVGTGESGGEEAAVVFRNTQPEANMLFEHCMPERRSAGLIGIPSCESSHEISPDTKHEANFMPCTAVLPGLVHCPVARRASPWASELIECSQSLRCRLPKKPSISHARWRRCFQ